MTAGYSHQQAYIAGEAQRLANADFSGSDQAEVVDSAAHASGKVCKTCGRTISAREPARRRGETEWSHDVCPVTG